MRSIIRMCEMTLSNTAIISINSNSNGRARIGKAGMSAVRIVRLS